MLHTTFIYRLHAIDSANNPVAYLGTCFPISTGGNMLTCRHVVDRKLEEGHLLGIFDNEMGVYRPLMQAPVIFQNQNADLALLPDALGRPKAEFVPILTPQLLKIGEEVYSFGNFIVGGDQNNIEAGYFSGRIVNFFQLHDQSAVKITLPYSIIEGLSGSPIMTYHNGPKLVGVATGNRRSRILASEIVEYKDEKVDFKETINRIVEFGIGMHCASVVSFLSSMPHVAFTVSDQAVPNCGL